MSAETITVETTGDFMLIDMLGGQEIEATGTTDVRRTKFVEDRIDSGQLKVVEPKKAAAAK